MKHTFLIAAAALSSFSVSTSAQDEPERSSSEAVAQTETPHPSPNAIVEAAQPEEWVSISAEDLVVMTLAPAADGSERKVIIQLMPAPFSQGWVSNIRTLARAKWYDGITVNRVQDNYVVQWGDPGHDNPESGQEDGTPDTKPLPEGLKIMGEDEYDVIPPQKIALRDVEYFEDMIKILERGSEIVNELRTGGDGSSFIEDFEAIDNYRSDDMLADLVGHLEGIPYGTDLERIWPIHCYGMVGVGRDYSPDTGSGAELYTVIGHAPRHLDRNIALVGRIISGMEHLSSLPRGSGTLGFYTEEEKDKRTPIVSVRVASDLPLHEQPAFDYLSTDSETFARYAEARANRRDPFFIVPAGGADICNIPVPVRRVETVQDAD